VGTLTFTVGIPIGTDFLTNQAQNRDFCRGVQKFLVFMVSIRIGLAFHKNRFCKMNTSPGWYLESDVSRKSI